jgi:endoribonuclease Dicer
MGLDFNKKKLVNVDWFANLRKVMPKTGLFLNDDFIYPILDISRTQENLEHFMRKINVLQIQNQMGYTFKDKYFLLQSLTHASYSINNITDSYERLEFLGDAILDFLITCYLHTANQNWTPGQITDLRSALVNNNTLASVAVRNGLHRHLLQQSPELFRRINMYVFEHSVHQTENTDGDTLIANLELFNEEDCPVLEHIEIPKVNCRCPK